MNKTNARWYAVRALSGLERSVGKTLLSRNIPGVEQVLVPTEKVKKNTRQGKPLTIEKVLFPGYAFLLADIQEPSGSLKVETWEQILAVNGVQGFVGTVTRQQDDETVMELTPISEAEVEAVRAYMVQNEETAGRFAADFKPNDPVTIVSGPFMGQQAVIKTLDQHKGTAQVRAQVFGREASVDIELASLEKVV